MITARVLILCLCAPAIASANTYVFHDLGALGGQGTVAHDLNARGQMVGSSHTPEQVQRATLWEGSSVTALGLLSGATSEALAVNNAGQIAGWATLNTRANNFDFDQHAVLWDHGNPIDLGTLGGPWSMAKDINNRGHVVGNAYPLMSGNMHAALWMGGSAIDLTPNATWESDAVGINDADVVVGYMSVPNPGGYQDHVKHAMRWDGTMATDLGTLGGMYSEAYAINNAGLIVGYSFTPGELLQQQLHAVIWRGTTLTDLHVASDSDAAGFSASFAFNVNNAGLIVGERENNWNDRHATLWNGNTAIDLNDQIEQSVIDAGWILRDALAISEDGCIVGSATLGTDLYPHAYLLVPVGAAAPQSAGTPTAAETLSVQALAAADAKPAATAAVGGAGATGLVELTALAALWLLISAAGLRKERRPRT